MPAKHSVKAKGPKAIPARMGYVDFKCTASPSFAEIHRFKSRAACLNGYAQVTVPTPCVLLPFPTAKQAKQFARVCNMTTEQQIGLLHSELYEKTDMNWNQASSAAKIALSALSLPSGMEGQKK